MLLLILGLALLIHDHDTCIFVMGFVYRYFISKSAIVLIGVRELLLDVILFS